MNQAELEKILQDEKLLYLGNDPKRIKQMKNSRNRRYVIWQYLAAFRKCQYWKSIREDGRVSGLQKRYAKVLFRYFDRKRNFLSERCGVEIGINSQIGRQIDIWHGGIVVNGRIGECCTLHGNIIIGNKGKGRESEFPVIGNHVDIGAGANIIGKLSIADDTVIGAGAVVTKSFDQPGAILTGIPAKQTGVREKA